MTGPRSARQSFSSVNGGSTRRAPERVRDGVRHRGQRADRAPSPMPFAPSGLSGDGDSTNAVAIGGISAAVSRL